MDANGGGFAGSSVPGGRARASTTRSRAVLAAGFAVALTAVLSMWVAPNTPARVRHKALGATRPAARGLWYRIVVYGASERDWSGVGNDIVCTTLSCPDQPGLFAGTSHELNKVTFFAQSQHAVILTQDSDRTAHTHVLVVGSYSYSEHDWTEYDHCFGGDVTRRWARRAFSMGT